MNERAFALGLAFRQGLLSVCKKLAEDEKRWITIHPNGKFDMNGDPIKGQPILIDDDRGEVIGGAGGALNGKKLKKKKTAKKPAKQTTQKKPNTKKPKQQTPKQPKKKNQQVGKNAPLADRIANDSRTLQEVQKSVQSKGIDVDQSLSNLDTELQRVNLIALDHLMDDYGGYINNALKGRNGTFSIDSRRMGQNTGGMASLTPFADGTAKLSITLNSTLLSDKNSYTQAIKSAIEVPSWSPKKVGWKMPIDDRLLPVATTLHEFGHIVSYAIAIKNNLNDPIYEVASEFMSVVKDCKSKVLSDATVAYSKESGKRQTKTSTSSAYMCEYGEKRNKPQEFFAEAFANAVGGKPNIIGVAMQNYLKGNVK